MFSIFKKISDFVNYWYLQYTYVTALYMLESWEVKIFNSLLIAFVAMISYTAYSFLPARMYTVWRLILHLAGAETPDEPILGPPMDANAAVTS